MEQMQKFIKGLKSQTRILLDASAGVTIRQMIELQVNDVIEKMCMNEYRSKSERSINPEIVGMPKGMLAIDTHTALLAQIELVNKNLAERGSYKAKVSQKKLVHKYKAGMFEKFKEILAKLQGLLKGGKHKLTKEHVNMTEKEEMTEPPEVPPKMKDPAEFTIACTIGGLEIQHDLCDLGSSINVISLRKFKELKIGEIIMSNMTLTLVDSSITHPMRIVHDVLVHVNGLTLSAYFMVIDMKYYSRGSVILGRPFLAIGKAKIDMETGEMTLKFNKGNVVFNAYKWTLYVEDLETCYQLEEKGSEVHKRMKNEFSPA
ncbi:uncharacterized protein LOC127129643 [Lathyrus oleraceus]|uniref:uncharacterized protein LOC127129643 n=1 Tax=Pisum sativum TaxID=3888 RepID=UPI0021CFD49C|nr:uncharacterized protein LOC127129643 [Pisum sativum]